MPGAVITRKPTLARLSELTHGQYADFFALLADKTRRVKRDGKAYFSCRFCDARRSVTFMAWDDENNPWYEACERDWHPGHFYKLRAVYEKHGIWNGAQRHSG